MFFFFKLAMENIIKDKRYAFTIIAVVFVCVFVAEFTIGYMDGFKQKLMGDALDKVGHINIYHEKFYDNLDFSPLEYNIPAHSSLINKLKNAEGVEFVRPEINFGAMANSEKDSSEAMVNAIMPEYENKIYEREQKNIIEGRFIKDDYEFAVGYRLAELIDAGVGDSIILLAMDQYGGMNAVEGRITGLLKTNNPLADESVVICSVATAQNLLALYDSVTSITLNIKDPWKSKEVIKELENILPPGAAAVPWQEEQEYLVGMGGLIDIWVYIIIGIVLLVAAMGISNSFLMNIMGRLPDFGVLRSMGLSRLRMFGMIMWESFILGLIGTMAGLLPGIGLVYYFQLNPINYGEMAEALEGFEGLDAVIGTALTPGGVIVVFVTGVLISVLAAVYPAAVAVFKKPSEILRIMQ